MSEIRKLQGIGDLSRVLPLRWLSSNNSWSGWLLVQNVKFLRRSDWLSLGWVLIPELIIYSRGDRFVYYKHDCWMPTLCINGGFQRSIKCCELNSTPETVYCTMPAHPSHTSEAFLSVWCISPTQNCSHPCPIGDDTNGVPVLIRRQCYRILQLLAEDFLEHAFSSTSARISFTRSTTREVSGKFNHH